MDRRGFLAALPVPLEPGGGSYRGYSFLVDKLVPALRARGLSAGQVETLPVAKPARAFAMAARTP